uniref:Uncharacterized protein n=1 Tax=Nicotiana tabacum TaxID=4097 RepID=A0A1S4CVU4_TOBAC
MSSQDINGTFSSRPACPSMPTPRPFIPPSSTPVIPSHGIQLSSSRDPPNIGVDSLPTSPCIDSDSVTQPPIHAQDPPNVGRLDDLGRLIIVPDKAGFWSDVPGNIRDMMFDEFRMKCVWPVEREVEVRGIFFKKCADRLTDMLREARNKKEMSGWITEDICIKLTEYWASEEFKKKSELAKAACLSDKGGSMHTGGSISIGAHRRRL